MADVWLGLDVIEEEARLQHRERRNYLRELREIQDPLDLTDTEFKERYRISSEILFNLIDVLHPHLQRTRITGLSVEKQILTALRFYATGCYQPPVGDQWGLSMTQSSVSRCIRDVTNIIYNTLFKQWIQFPIALHCREVAREQFRNAHQPFPGAIGAIDCTHVAICTPRVHENLYVNHHGYHSLNVQMICDPNLKILRAMEVT